MQRQLQSVLAKKPDQCADTPPAPVCSNRDLSFLMGSYDALSGTVAEHARGSLRTSGPSLACSSGYRNANDASWRELVDPVKRIMDSTALPVLVVGDSSFGRLNNARRARKLSRVTLSASRWATTDCHGLLRLFASIIT
ncbi:2-methylisocitrate lyase-like PEP mutase family enzyme [Bradyrhizobium sp. IAR9]|nr:2-methylisocitrate lyase-like PEP mutase family enzyme [Bradyrhizobium sp. IAR9]